MTKQILACFLLLIMLLAGVAYPLRARAVLGILDIDLDPADIAKWILDTLLKTIIETLRKRLLDSMVDQIITWIQGGGDPKFIQNPGQFFEDALQAAAGDTALKLGQANLCYEPQYFRLRLNLITPVFSERISCTLDDIVENIGAFRDDFRKGSWIAYQESLKPNNNPWGVQLMVQNEFLNKQSENKEAARYEATVGGGFLGQKRCNQWEKQPEPELEELGLVEPTGEKRSGEAYYFEAPDGFEYTGKVERPSGSGWKCVQPETITPGRTVGETVAKAVGSDIDYLIKADELEQYIAAIADAAINRLTKEAVEGLAYTTKSGRETNCEELEGGVKAACITLRTIKKTYKWILDLVLWPLEHLGIDLNTDVESYEEEEDFGSFAKRSLLTLLQNNDPGGKLVTAEESFLNASSINTGLISTLNELITCQEGLDEPINPNATTTLAIAEERTDKINEELFPQIEIFRVTLQAMPGRIEVAEESELEGLREEVLNLISGVNSLLGEATGLESVVNGLSTQAETDLEQCQAP